MSRVDKTSTDRLKTAVLLLAAIGLLAGLAFYVAGKDDIATLIWIAGVMPALAALVVEILRSIGRGEVGLDIVAALSMTAALVFGETLAAAVVAVMYSGGTFLESFAQGRARRAMHALLSRVPRTATRHRDGGLEEVPLDEIAPRDRLLIRQGDVVPVDGAVASAAAFLDTSALTGEFAAGAAGARRRGHERLDQCGRGLRPDGRAARKGPAEAVSVRRPHPHWSSRSWPRRRASRTGSDSPVSAEHVQEGRCRRHRADRHHVACLSSVSGAIRSRISSSPRGRAGPPGTRSTACIARGAALAIFSRKVPPEYVTARQPPPPRASRRRASAR